MVHPSRESSLFSIPPPDCSRMFPTVRCSFSNLDGISPDRLFAVVLDIVPSDDKRYRYAYHRSSWLVAGKSDPAPPQRCYPHPDGPFNVNQLRKQIISFEKVKLTNNELDKSGQVRISFFVITWYLRNSRRCSTCVNKPLQIILNSMHKFQPRIHLVPCRQGRMRIGEIAREMRKTFVFPETAFMAVTAYQNQLVSTTVA